MVVVAGIVYLGESNPMRLFGSSSAPGISASPPEFLHRFRFGGATRLLVHREGPMELDSRREGLNVLTRD